MASLVQKIAMQAFRTFFRPLSPRLLTADGHLTSQGSPAESTSEPMDQLKLSKLLELVNKTTPDDVGLDYNLINDNTRNDYNSSTSGHIMIMGECNYNLFRKHAFKQNSDEPPAIYIRVVENQILTMGIFILRNGARLPLHDHPGMHGLIKVIHGVVQIKSYSAVSDSDSACAELRNMLLRSNNLREKQFFLVQENHSCGTVNAQSDALFLTPTKGNFHELTAVDGPSAFLDILSPPYHSAPGLHECHYYEIANMPNDCIKLLSREARTIGDDLHLIVRIPPPEYYWTESAEYRGPEIGPLNSGVL